MRGNVYTCDLFCLTGCCHSFFAWVWCADGVQDMIAVVVVCYHF